MTTTIHLRRCPGRCRARRRVAATRCAGRRTAGDRPAPCRKRAHAIDADRRLEPLDRLLAQVFGIDQVRHAAYTAFETGVSPGFGERVQPSGEIDGISGDRVLGRRAAGQHGRHHLAAGDADVQLEGTGRTASLSCAAAACISRAARTARSGSLP